MNPLKKNSYSRHYATLLSQSIQNIIPIIKNKKLEVFPKRKRLDVLWTCSKGKLETTPS